MEVTDTVKSETLSTLNESQNEVTTDESNTARNLGFYVRALRHQLPEKYFEPRPQRIGWLFFYSAILAACLYGITLAETHWLLKLPLSILAGVCFGAFGFIAHELLHGSIFKSQKISDFFSYFLLIPFFIGPTYWRFWHNRLHHSKTQQLIADPDAYPTTKIYKHSKFMQFMFPFTPGSGHKRSYLYFFIWFSTHTFVSQFYLRFRNKIYDQMNQRRVSLEFYSQIIIWLAFVWSLGLENIVFTWFIPFLVQNYFVMSYIATNHNLNPLTKTNDPLANSLTVTNHPWLEFFHFNFGYHVEHHIFPTMSGAYTKHVHKVLLKDFPDTYHIMTKWEAMKGLYKTARIYKNSTTLINPETGTTYETLGVKN